MTSALMQDHMLLTCLGQNIVRLTLTEHSEGPMLSTVNIDCLSSMSKLQHLEINSKVRGKVWSTQGLLSSLDCLERFTFLGDGTLQGPLLPAFAVLPNLTTLRFSNIPGGRVESCSAHFTALTSFVVVDFGNAEGPHNLHIAFGQPLSSLCKLALTACHITSMPVSLRLVSSLARVKFERCSFTVDDWLHQALERTTQVTSLTLRNSYDGVPDSVFQMVGLQQLKLPYSGLTDLPAKIVQLSNLTRLNLSDNDMSCVPQTLEQMTHLRYINLEANADPFQLTRPLTFLSTFHNLEYIHISCYRQGWNSLSMFHIGQLEAALDKAFKHRVPAERPLCNYGF